MVISVVLLVGCRVGLFRCRLVRSRFFLLGWRRPVLVGLAVEMGHIQLQFHVSPGGSEGSVWSTEVAC